MEKVNIRGRSEKVTPESLKNFPRSSGVYIMKSRKGRVLYIGKALNLKSRVSSYFLQGERRFQLPFLMEKVHSIEYIVTNNENEALILEANLIREEKPPYNFELKDDKHYPYLKITAEEEFPRLIVTRRVRNDGGDYFGPYTESGNMNRLRRLILKLFRIRTCRKLRNRERPCINYSMGRCSAPCAGYITPEEYMERVRAVKRFLRGRHKDAVEILRGMMKRAASVHAYERSAEIRDSINLIESRRGNQSVDLCSPDTGFDVFGVDTQGVSVSVCVLRFRNGVLISRRSFLIKREVWEASSNNRDSLIISYYTGNSVDYPDEILLPEGFGFNTESLTEWFRKERGLSLRITLPKRGQKRDILRIALENARSYSVQSKKREITGYLREVLELENPPEIIEAFDISNLGDTHPVAGVVRFSHGEPDRKEFRRLKIKGTKGQNDFDMMKEAVHRRLSRLIKEGKRLPDLLLIDGGKGQLSSAYSVLSEFENPPEIISIAKREELVYRSYSSKPLVLEDDDPAKLFLMRIRDSVHDTAVRYHRKRRVGSFNVSELMKVPGVGEKTAKRLLREFGSVKRIRETDAEEISRVKGVSEKIADEIVSEFHKE